MGEEGGDKTKRSGATGVAVRSSSVCVYVCVSPRTASARWCRLAAMLALLFFFSFLAALMMIPLSLLLLSPHSPLALRY